MKSTLFLLIPLFIYSSLQGQVYGNKVKATKEVSFESIRHIELNLNIDFNIYASADETKVVIESEKNIIDLIGLDHQDGKLQIDQVEWIEYNMPCIVNIYTNDLEYVYNDSWSNVNIYDINQESLTLHSSIGKLNAFGKVDDLSIITKQASIDASQLLAKRADVKITSDGTVSINAQTLGKTNIDDEATLNQINLADNTTISSSIPKKEVRKEKPNKIDTRFIKVNIKNNSLERVHAYVKGPKPDGKYFSYGLSWFPMASKQETWSIGTKLYKVGILGHRRLLLEIKEEDEGQTIKLFGNS